jgi:hypothetical protein
MRRNIPFQASPPTSNCEVGTQTSLQYQMAKSHDQAASSPAGAMWRGDAAGANVAEGRGPPRAVSFRASPRARLSLRSRAVSPRMTRRRFPRMPRRHVGRASQACAHGSAQSPSLNPASPPRCKCSLPRDTSRRCACVARPLQPLRVRVRVTRHPPADGGRPP